MNASIFEKMFKKTTPGKIFKSQIWIKTDRKSMSLIYRLLKWLKTLILHQRGKFDSSKLLKKSFFFGKQNLKLKPLIVFFNDEKSMYLNYKLPKKWLKTPVFTPKKPIRLFKIGKKSTFFGKQTLKLKSSILLIFWSKKWWKKCI